MLPSNSDRVNHQAESLREVKYKYSNNLAELLTKLQVSLLFSTYQAGKLGVVTARNNSLNFGFHNFDRAMGIANSPTQMALGGKDWIYFLRNDQAIAPQLEPPGSYDACYLTRGGQYTGDISVHDLAWGGKELWLVNTRFSCLCTLSNSFNFLPQWRPAFISAIAPEDRCHLNGLAMVAGMPKYVTVLGQTDTPGGWRERKASGGCVLEVPSSKVVARGLSMPHSPRVTNNTLWVLNSGCGELLKIDLASGKSEIIVTLPGYTRGLALIDKYAFVGLSQIRETAIFGNLPIGDRFDNLKCGIAVVDLSNQQMVGLIEFSAGIEEIFDLQISKFVLPMISGPYATAENNQIWSLPKD